MSYEWPGLPAGVKFDPSDIELLEHLAGKCGVGNSKAHILIEEFIPTLDSDEGICYTHPENLPGAKKDGSSIHFFHRTIKAYATGQRKRRKIHDRRNSSEDHVRWHKTGKTKLVVENGVQKGFKKIMVLYKSSKKGSKPQKTNWCMHQYHLGIEEDEKEGEFVVSKIFYKQQEGDGGDIIDESDLVSVVMLRTSPRTPKTNTPNPREGKSRICDDLTDDNVPNPYGQVSDVAEASHPSIPDFNIGDEMKYPLWLAGESQPPENSHPSGLDDSLLCNENFESYAPLGDSSYYPAPSFACNTSSGVAAGEKNATSGFSDLENLELDTPPDFQLADLQFGSQDSIFEWLNRY